jgi:hypothetical protein
MTVEVSVAALRLAVTFCAVDGNASMSKATAPAAGTYFLKEKAVFLIIQRITFVIFWVAEKKGRVLMGHLSYRPKPAGSGANVGIKIKFYMIS